MPDLPLQPHTDLWQHTLNPPAGAPVLMLHGNGEDHRSLLPLAQRLAARHAVHLLDSRNHGQSARHADCSYAAMAGDVAALIERWQAQAQAQGRAADAFALVGFSAMIASAFTVCPLPVTTGRSTAPERCARSPGSST